MTSNFINHSRPWELHASSMTVDLASSRMGRSWLKIEVDDIKRQNPQSAMGAARFQRDRGFGFQPNMKPNVIVLNGTSSSGKSGSDRRKGLARSQFDIVHASKPYDLVIDTSILTPEDCATKILNVRPDR
jgi:hypothetical protein